MTTIRMRLTEADVIAAMRAHYLNALRRPTRLVFWGRIVLIAGALAALFLPLESRSMGGFDLPWFAVAILVGVPIAMYAVTIPMTARKAFRQQKNLGGEIEMNWDDRRLISRGGYGTSDYAWGDYHAFLERNGMVLLYQSEAMYQVAVARSFPSDAVRAEMIAYLQAAGVPAAGGKRPAPKPA